MSTVIREMFNDLCSHVTIDRRFLRNLHDLQLGFVNKSEDHISFFSSGLTGVYTLRFTDSERDAWFDTILEVNESDIKEGLRKVPRDIIDPKWHRATDPFNHSCVWLMYRIHTDEKLSAREKEQGLQDVVLYLQYRFLGSLMSNYFRYPADEATATATYEIMSRKFDLKRLGSWYALLQYRTESIIDTNGIHYPTYSTLRDDAAIVRMFQDIQERLKEIIKKIWKVFARVKEENLKISSSSSTIEMDEGIELLDKAREQTRYRRYLHSVVDDKPTFIRSELVTLVVNILPTIPEKLLYDALSYCSDNYGRRGDPKVERLMDATLTHAFAFLSENTGVMRHSSDLPEFINRLKNLYMASRMNNELLLEMRDLSDHIVERSVKSRNKAVQSSVRTGLQIYIALRTFSRNHYTG